VAEDDVMQGILLANDNEKMINITCQKNILSGIL
jgi:hypothetical protein